MATYGPGNPRKKVATYGKAARKQVYGFGRDVPLTPSRKSAKAAWGADEPGVTGAADDPVSPTTGRKVASSGASRPATDHQTRAPPAARSGAGLGNIKATTPKRPNFGKTVSPQRAQHDEVFDVPSSDDDAVTPRTTTKRPSRPTSKPATTVKFANGLPSPANDAQAASKALKSGPSTQRDRDIVAKKRKAHAGTQDDASPVEFDDDALQRHIALQTILDIDTNAGVKESKLCSAFEGDAAPRRPRKTGKRSASPERPAKTKALKSPAIRAPAPGPTAIEQRPSKAMPLPRPLDTRAAVPQEGKPPRRGQKSPGTPAAADYTGASQHKAPPRTGAAKSPTKARQLRSPRLQKTPPRQTSQPSSKTTTPGSRQAPSAATTPRQSHLWSTLLDDNSTATPGQLPVDSLSISQGRTVGAVWSELVEDAAESDVSAATRPQNVRDAPRKKLIDSLEDELNTTLAGVESEDEDDEDLTLLPMPAAEPSRQETMEAAISQLTAPRSNAESQFTSSQGTSQSTAGGPKFTYARDRSYLTETAVDEATMLNTPLDVGLGSQSRRRGAPNPALLSQVLGPVDEEQDVIDGNSGTIRSIHELRQAGGNKRFLDESEALFEDIECRGTSAVSRRRNGMIELGTKLAEKGFARRFVERGMDLRLLRGLDGERDIITGFAMSSIMVLLAQDGVGATGVLQARQQGAPALLTRLIDERRSIMGIAKDRSSNMSKVARAAATDFAEVMRKSSVWGPTRPDTVTPHVTALRCMATMARQSREAGDKDGITSSEATGKLVAVLDLEGGDHDDEEDDDEPSAQEVMEMELALSVLESSTLKVRARPQRTTRDSLDTAAIRRFFLAVSQRPREQFKTCQVLVARLVLNVSNISAAACDELGSDEVVRTLVHATTAEFGRLGGRLDDEERLSSVDQLVLALATLTNLAERSDAARRHVLGDDGQGGELLDGLTHWFMRGLERAGEVGAPFSWPTSVY